MRWDLGALALLCGCAVLHEPSPRPGPDDPPWGPERDRLTRHAKLYDLLDDRAFVTALYEPMSLRAARVDRIAVWRALTPPEKAKLYGAELAEAASQEDFLLAFYTGNRSDNDLDAPRSVWRVALLVGDLEILPARIERVRSDSELRMLYPAIGDFDTLYRLRFPPWKGERPLVDLPFALRIAGAEGKIDLEWKSR